MKYLYKKFLVSRMFIDEGFSTFVVPWGLSQKGQREQRNWCNQLHV